MWIKKEEFFGEGISHSLSLYHCVTEIYHSGVSRLIGKSYYDY